MKYLSKVSLLVIIIILTSMPAYHSSAEENDFGESDRTINEMLQTPANEELDTDANHDEDNDMESEEDSEEVVPLSDENEPLRGDQNLFFLTLQLFLALGVVLLGIYALLKFINKRAQNFNSHSTIQNIGGVGVGSNRSVQMVRVGNRLFVVGVGENVELLKEIDDQEEIAEMIKSNQTSDAIDQPIARFTDWLQKKKTGKSPYSNEVDFHNLLDREMKEVKKSHNKVHSALEEKDR